MTTRRSYQRNSDGTIASTLNQRVGENARRLLTERGMRAADVVRQSDGMFSAKSVSELLGNRQIWTAPQIDALANILGVPPSQLVANPCDAASAASTNLNGVQIDHLQWIAALEAGDPEPIFFALERLTDNADTTISDKVVTYRQWIAALRTRDVDFILSVVAKMAREFQRQR